MATPAKGGKKDVPQIDKAETKKLFAKAKKKPIGCGIAQASDGSILLLMHKTKTGMAMKKAMDDEFGEVTNPRWGTAFIDKTVDSKLVILDMNKNLAGAARKLKKALKGTGVTKIRLVVEGSVAEAMEEVEPGDENEPEVPEDDEADEAEAHEGSVPGAPPAPEPMQATGAATPQFPTDAAPPAPPPAAAPPGPDAAAPPAPDAAASPAFDMVGMTKRLGDLFKKMADVIRADPTKGTALTELAKQAGNAVKTQDAEAPKKVDAFEAALGAGGGGSAAAPAQDPAKQAALKASPKLWNDTITVVASGLDKLKDAIRKDFATEAPEVMADIEKNLTKIDKVTARFDKQLADLLDGVNAATDEAARKAGLAKARSVLADHIKYAASEPLIAMIDDNPFGVPTEIKKTLVANLKQLADAVR